MDGRGKSRDCKFLSTPSARRATILWDSFKHFMGISIHALREESDRKKTGENLMHMQFLSTPSARRATKRRWEKYQASNDFYPRPPRGERRIRPVGMGRHHQISIHALREESDFVVFVVVHGKKQFLSTPSARRATRRPRPACHRPRHFYPRPPRGERPEKVQKEEANEQFLSTPSARRATVTARPGSGCVTFISIHALREESDTRSAIWPAA